MKALRLGALSVVVGVLGAAAPAFADWRLDDSIRALTDRERAALERGVSNAPSKALERILDEETAHLESLADEAFGPFTQEAWGRLTAAREEGHLWQEIRAVLGEAGVTSRELITRAWRQIFIHRLGALLWHQINTAARRNQQAHLAVWIAQITEMTRTSRTCPHTRWDPVNFL